MRRAARGTARRDGCCAYRDVAEYNARALGNAFLDTWHGNEDQLSASLPEAVATYQNVVAAEDFDAAPVFVSEAAGRVRQVRPAAEIVTEMADEAARILNG